jgi:hypothetical protein
MDDLDAVTAYPGIGKLKERSLHAGLKAWCALPGDRLEVVIEGYVVDVVRGDRLIEVQTAGIGAIQAKLAALAAAHDVQVVYPLIASKTIETLAADGATVLRRRRSPTRQVWAHLFDEMVRCPRLLDTPRLELLAARVAVTEVRRVDGQGSWRRKGVSIVDTRLEGVIDTRLFRSTADLLELLPGALAAPYTHRELAGALGVRLATAQRASYCLRHAGLLESAGKRGRSILVRPVPEQPSP